MKKNILDIETSLLLIIDIQERILQAQFNKEKIVKNSLILIKAAKILDIPIIVSEQYPKGLGLTIPEIKEILPEKTAFFEKTAFSCCYQDSFKDLLKSFNKKQLIICGMESHVCVYQTVFDLISLDYETYLIHDAISSRKEYEYNTGIEKMVSYGAILNCTEMALLELLKSAGHPQFKAVQNLIK